MSQVIDLSQNKYADQAGDNIVKIIEASAKAKQSQVDLQKQLLIDQITRARNRQDKQLEQQDEMNNWGKMFGQEGQQGNPVANNTGMANAATPKQVATPVEPIGGQIPQGGYTEQNPPPMSMADGSNQPQIQAEMSRVAQPQPQPQQPQIPIKTQLEEQLGFIPKKIPRYIPEMGPNGPRWARNPDYKYGSSDTYNEAIDKNNRGEPLSPGEVKLIKGNIPGMDNVSQERQDRLLKNQEFSNSTRLRQEFINRPEVKDYITVAPNIRAMDSLLDNALSGNIDNAVALDQGLITMYNKLTDPQSVVRESEYARTPGNLPFVNRFKGAFQKIEKGGAGMTNDDRKALVQGAKIIANERGNQYQSTLDEYKNTASSYGMDEKLITRGMPNFDSFSTSKDDKISGTGPMDNSPAVGTIDGGYKFKGGDPSNPNSWEKV